MGFDDGKYYQNCNLICVAPSGYDGKSVSITDGTKSYSATISNNIATFMLPGRTQYTVKLMNESSIAYQTTVELGYGECVELHLETGYEEVIKRDLMSLEAISAATGDLTKAAPSAEAVKTLNSNLGGIQIKEENGILQWSKDGNTWNSFSMGLQIGDTVSATLTDNYGVSKTIDMKVSYIDKTNIMLLAVDSWATNKQWSDVNRYKWSYSIVLNGKTYTGTNATAPDAYTVRDKLCNPSRNFTYWTNTSGYCALANRIDILNTDPTSSYYAALPYLNITM